MITTIFYVCNYLKLRVSILKCFHTINVWAEVYFFFISLVYEGFLNFFLLRYDDQFMINKP